MRYFVELAKRELQQAFVYRADWIFGFISSFFIIFIQVSIWKALYSGRGEVAGVTLTEMITYVLVARVVGTITRTRFIFDIEGDVRYGDIGMKLVRPVLRCPYQRILAIIDCVTGPSESHRMPPESICVSVV